MQRFAAICHGGPSREPPAQRWEMPSQGGHSQGGHPPIHTVGHLAGPRMDTWVWGSPWSQDGHVATPPGAGHLVEVDEAEARRLLADKPRRTARRHDHAVPVAGRAGAEPLEADARLWRPAASAGWTHHVAEYRALIRGLEAARSPGIGHLRVCLDSALLVNQLNGRSKVKAEHLKPLHDQAVSLIQQFADIKITWVPREANAEADALASTPLGPLRPSSRAFNSDDLPLECPPPRPLLCAGGLACLPRVRARGDDDGPVTARAQT